MVVVMAVVVASLAIGALRYRAAYGTFAPWSEPTRISWCGRVFLPGYALTRSQLGRFLPDGQSVSDLRPVVTTPPLIGHEVYAVQQRGRAGAHGVCAMAVFLGTGPGTYRIFGLSGGP